MVQKLIVIVQKWFIILYVNRILDPPPAPPWFLPNDADAKTEESSIKPQFKGEYIGFFQSQKPILKIYYLFNK